MNVQVIEYERLKALGQFENHRGKVVIECQPTDNPAVAFEYAKALVNYHLQAATPLPVAQNQTPGM